MTNPDIASRRLYNQLLTHPAADQPGDVVAWLGAVQSQDYASAKWALGLRMQPATEGVIEQAFNDGAILRTHVMRPTWHFVAPTDICWMLELTAPRVHAANGTQYRQLELNEALCMRSNAAIAKALQGGRQLTRLELGSALEEAGIPAPGLRLAYFVMRAELDAVVCSGPRRGKQFTYMLLEERAPGARHLEREEALAKLVQRYFLSHGPATPQDFVWWSGLTLADATNGLEMVKSQLDSEVIDGRTYWFSTATAPAREPSLTAYLLPNYDEFGSYRDRSAIFDAAQNDQLFYSHTIVIQGKVVGTWKRTFQKDAVVLTLAPFTPLTEAEGQALAAAASRLGEFLGKKVLYS